MKSLVFFLAIGAVIGLSKVKILIRFEKILINSKLNYFNFSSNHLHQSKKRHLKKNWLAIAPRKKEPPPMI